MRRGECFKNMKLYCFRGKGFEMPICEKQRKWTTKMDSNGSHNVICSLSKLLHFSHT